MHCLSSLTIFDLFTPYEIDGTLLVYLDVLSHLISIKLELWAPQEVLVSILCPLTLPIYPDIHGLNS